MKRITQAFGVCLSLATAGQAAASTFDQCVLEHMQGVTSDKAAIAIKESCLHTVAAPLPPEVLNALSAGSQASYGEAPANQEGGAGLYITLNNQSGYDLTELTIEVGDKNDPTVRDRYRVDRFSRVPQSIIELRHPYPDPIDNGVIRSGIREIFVRIGKWNESSSNWGFVAAKGFPTASNQADSGRSAVVQANRLLYENENVHDACKAYADILSRRHDNPTAEVTVEEAIQSSLCSGFILGAMHSVEGAYKDGAHNETYTSQGYKWCGRVDYNNHQRGRYEQGQKILSAFTKYLKKQEAVGNDITFANIEPKFFPAAMSKAFPCRQSP
jgi:hypothetical protein